LGFFERALISIVKIPGESLTLFGKTNLTECEATLEKNASVFLD
jgi:hypothetical protein